MKKFFKKHVGLIIFMILLVIFPASLSNQTRLNMRIIVTGLAIDKADGEYEVTAQVVKITPSTDSGVSGASMTFISDKGENIISAMSKLSYKTGKVSAFSHTNFIVLGNDLMTEDNITESLDYFIRNSLIRNSAVVLASKGKASDEIKKTKNVDLSVGLGIQKVFMYKEKESDGKMLSLIDFANMNRSKSKTALVSTLSLKSESEGEKSQESSKESENQPSIGQTQSSQSSGSSQNEGGQFFESQTPLVCFVDGKKVGLLEDDEIHGFMLSQASAKSDDITISGVSEGKLKNAQIGIKIKKKRNKAHVRFENEIPVIDILVDVTDSEIEEIKNENFVATLSESEFAEVKKQFANEIRKKVSEAFEKGKTLGADIFGAYEKAYRFNYKALIKYYDSYEEFLQNLRLNVNVEIKQLEY